MSGLAGLMLFIGWLLGGRTGVFWAIGIAVVVLALSPRVSPRVILRMYGARELTPLEAPRLAGILEMLAARARLPRPPRLYYVPSAMLNAFSVGGRADSGVAVTDGLLRALTVREVTGVLAHEISHIRHNDMWVMNLADMASRITSTMSLLGQALLLINLPLLLLGGYVLAWLPILVLIAAPLISMLLQLALSRSREFDADREAALLSGDPRGLALALAKMSRYEGRFWERILLPGRREPHPSLLRTHPETEERVRRLMELEEHPELGAPVALASGERDAYPPLPVGATPRGPRWRPGLGFWR